MVIIDTSAYRSVEEYIKKLSKRARHEYTYMSKKNCDLVYQKANFQKDKVHYFMQLWERQLVRGKPIQWAYPIETVCDWNDKEELALFEAKKGEEILAMHFLRKEEGFWEAHSPMWDKANLSSRHLGTYMWFHMVFYGIENKIGIINFGGGVDRWREMIRTRKSYTNPKYKWRFIPKDIKENPDLQPDYEIVTEHGRKILIQHGCI